MSFLVLTKISPTTYIFCGKTKSSQQFWWQICTNPKQHSFTQIWLNICQNNFPKQFSLLGPYSQIYVPLIQILVQFNPFFSFILLREGTLVGYNVVGHSDHYQNLYVCLFVCLNVIMLYPSQIAHGLLLHFWYC